jgi:hypothetical protein
MSDPIECSIHGKAQPAYVCHHLKGDSVALGFNRNDPDDEKPFPDAWCDDCELIRAAHGGWNEESEKLTKISILCAGCYERARIRNTRTDFKLEELCGWRWKCASCDEWHFGPCLDFVYDFPHHWLEKYEANNSGDVHNPTFLNADYCGIEGRDFFVRGIIDLPIVGSGETFRWGVWGSLSQENFEKLLEMDDDPKRVELPPMFSWLSTNIAEYPDTLNLKMYAHVRPLGELPLFELELSDHPLSQEFHQGIKPERVKDIMIGRLNSETI